MTNAFHMLLTIALNYQNIKQNPERKSKIKLLVNQYYWKEIDYLSHKKKRNIYHIKKIGKSLNQVINQLLLIFSM